MHDRSQALDNQISKIQSQLSALPPGKMICARNGAHFKWYHSDSKGYRTYIPKKNRSLAEHLALKNYLSLLCKDLLLEKKAIDSYLRYYPSSPGQKARALAETPGYQELLAPYFKPNTQELFEWMKAPYSTNENHPEHLSHKTASGHKVRSKSEALIDTILYTNQIPFRYEYVLRLGEITLYPDFTIRHPLTGKYFYWEHFGLMDNSTYSKNAYDKLQLYTSHGILPTVHLITTFESKEHPLDSDYVTKLVNHYFL